MILTALRVGLGATGGNPRCSFTLNVTAGRGGRWLHGVSEVPTASTHTISSES